MDLQAFTTDLVAAMAKLHGTNLPEVQSSRLWQSFRTAVLGDAASPEAEGALYAEMSEWLAYRSEIQGSIRRARSGAMADKMRCR